MELLGEQKGEGKLLIFWKKGEPAEKRKKKKERKERKEKKRGKKKEEVCIFLFWSSHFGIKKIEKRENPK